MGEVQTNLDTPSCKKPIFIPLHEIECLGKVQKNLDTSSNFVLFSDVFFV